MKPPFYFENTMRCGCKATMRQDFDGRDIQIVQMTPEHTDPKHCEGAPKAEPGPSDMRLRYGQPDRWIQCEPIP